MYIRITSLSLLLSLVSVNVNATSSLDYKFIKTFQSSAGAVRFDHEAHAMGRVKDCAKCHSAMKTFGGKVSELFAHNFCKACHESNNGPTECNGCHRQKKAD
jgi:hypothetical protein